MYSNWSTLSDKKAQNEENQKTLATKLENP
jgi:hypothetical protein